MGRAMKPPVSGFVLLACALLLGSACTPRQDFRGAQVDEERLKQIEERKPTQGEVFALIGSPSSVSTFPQKKETWYYIFKETERVAFFDEKVKDQRVIVIDFDDTGRVERVRRYGAEDAKEVQVVDRMTPTRGRELGFFEQIFGNLGRFNDQNTGRIRR